MGKGGARVGAGRKAGSLGKKSRKINIDRILNATGTGPDKMPLAFLLAVVNAPESEDIKLSERIQCAIAAAPYCHQKQAIAQVTVTNRSAIAVQSDLAKALRDLAEVARLREAPMIDGEVLEGSAQDKMSYRADQDKMSYPAKMSYSHTGGQDVEIVVVGIDGGDDGA